MKTAILLLTAACLTACGTQEEKAKEPRTVDTGDLTAALYCGKEAAPATLALTDPDLRRVPADQLRLLNGDVEMSLCDLLRDSGKKALVLQFASVRCYSCLKWIDQVANPLDKKGFGAQVLSVVAMTDRLETLDEDEAKRVKKEVAKKALWVHDFYGDLWSFFSTEPWDPTTEAVVKPLLVTMDVDARGFFTQDTTLDGAEVAAMAEKVLGVKLAP